MNPSSWMNSCSRVIVGPSSAYGPMYSTCAADPSLKDSSRSSRAAGCSFFVATSSANCSNISAVTLEGWRDHHAPVPVGLIASTERAQVTRPPESFECRDLELLAASLLDRELRGVGHRVQRLDGGGVGRARVRVAVAVDAQEVDLGHLDERRRCLCADGGLRAGEQLMWSELVAGCCQC